MKTVQLFAMVLLQCSLSGNPLQTNIIHHYRISVSGFFFVHWVIATGTVFFYSNTLIVEACLRRHKALTVTEDLIQLAFT